MLGEIRARLDDLLPFAYERWWHALAIARRIAGALMLTRPACRRLGVAFQQPQSCLVGPNQPPGPDPQHLPRRLRLCPLREAALLLLVRGRRVPESKLVVYTRRLVRPARQGRQE